MKKTIDDRILSFLIAKGGRSYKTKELAREIDLPKQGEEYQALKEALRRLQLEGRILRLKNSRWMAPMAAEEALAAEDQPEAVLPLPARSAEPVRSAAPARCVPCAPAVMG